ncbi:MAG: radical SAM protein [Deltaproteobacteria bacterium]|nr:radical SAM protein [Deltaproteobacteria bacterium]
MPHPDRVRVLLLWPGGLFSGGKNFGVPQLLSLAAAVRASVDAVVEVVDLDLERAFGKPDLRKIFERGYDVVGISCYSSYDYLKVMAIAEQARSLLPRAWLVVGGYHPSARPHDFTATDSPFDCVVVGEGERPFTRIVKACDRGDPAPKGILGPEPVHDLGELPPLDWTLLERYRPHVRKVASQAEIYLSRGCPFGCTFCMERAKKEESWRALDPESAVEAMHRLDAFLDLSRFTLRVTDALFGLRPEWRREVLERLAARPLRARKIWLLTRLDLLERQDIELMARAHVSPGFGVESGSPAMLRTIRKSSAPEQYLDSIHRISEWALEYRVPFGINLIVGHPGETEDTLRETAQFARRLFLRAERTMGFLSVDPFRLYPGSEIDRDLPAWQARTGMRNHRYPWWQDGDQAFLSEWVDASAGLGYRATFRLKDELFSPILREIPSRFCYEGESRDYFLRAIEEQVELCSPRRRMQWLGLWHLWTGLVNESTAEQSHSAVAEDSELGSLAVQVRQSTLGEGAEPQALLAVPRERFVAPSELGDCCLNRASKLAEDSERRLLPMKSFAAMSKAIELAEGDEVVVLGDGTGYGAALCCRIVGDQGKVVCIEQDPDLASVARANLRESAHARVIEAPPGAIEHWAGARKVMVSLALAELPDSWVDALAEGGVLVAMCGNRLVLKRKALTGLPQAAPP